MQAVEQQVLGGNLISVGSVKETSENRFDALGVCHAARAPSAGVLTITVMSTFYPTEARSSNLSQSLKFLPTEKTTADQH